LTFVLEQSPEGTDLVLTGNWSAEAAACLEGGGADGLVLNYARGYRERDLRFVEALPIHRLHVLARSVSDLSPIYSLGDRLKSLRVQSDPSAIIDLDRLPELGNLSATWSQVHRSVGYAHQLERLTLLSFTEPDLTALSPLSSLTALVLKDYPRVRSLAGIEAFPWIVEIGVHLGRSLEDISALRSIASPALQTLQLPSCRNVVDIQAVASCPSLRFFDLAEGATIKSVAPLEGLSQLERLYLYGSTRISDCDLSPIARLPSLKDFRIQNRRGYSPSVKEIQDAIARRR
jgi:hypothetical protein